MTEGLLVSHCPMVPFSAYDFHFVLSFPCRSCRDGHSAKVFLCFLESPLLFVLLLTLFMVRIIFSCRSCRDGQSLSFNEERYQRRSKGKFLPLGFPSCCHGAMPTCWHCAHVRSTSQVARYAARRGCVASHRIATLPCSTPQSAGGSVPFIVCGSVRLCYVVDAVRYELAHRFPTVSAARFSK